MAAILTGVESFIRALGRHLYEVSDAVSEAEV